MRIVQRIARQTAREVDELPPLYDTLDPEALDALSRSLATDSARITFEYVGHEVEVAGDGTVSIAPLE